MGIKSKALLCATLLISAGFPIKPLAGEVSKEKTKNWSVKMRALYHSLAEFLTDVSSDKRFNDPSNRSRIESNATNIARLAHGLKMDTPAPDSDISRKDYLRLFRK